MTAKAKRITALFCILFILFALFSGCSYKSAYSPALYKLQAENGTVIYFFGSIHVGNEETYPLPEKVISAYNSSEYLAVECDIAAYESDISAITQTASDMMCEPGTYIYDYVGHENYEAAVQLLEEYGLYNEYYDHFMPVFWISLLGEVPLKLAQLDSDKGIDRHFLQSAKEDGKPILEIESVQEQMDMQLNFSMPLQILLFEQCLLEPKAQGLAIKLMYENWRQGSQTALTGEMDYSYEELAEIYGEEEGRLYYEYYYELGEKRNIKMADTAEKYIEEEKNVFYVVGAAHMGGENGIISLLEQRGYSIEKIEY